jgi:integrase/recombinase XerD
LARVDIPHVDLIEGTITIPKTKNGKARVVGLDAAAIKAIRNYLRSRERHSARRSPKLWLSNERGPLSSDGMRQAIRERVLQAGVDGISAHCYRRSLAERWLAAGGSETLLRYHAGWQSPAMTARYVRSNGQKLALSEHRRLMS